MSEKQIHLLKRQIEILQSESEHLNRQNTALHTSVIDLNSTLDSERFDYHLLTETNENLLEQIATLNSENAQQVTQIGSLLEQIATLNSENAQQATQITTLNNENKQLMEQINSLKTQLNELMKNA